MTNEQIKKRLFALAEPCFQRFSSRLIPNIDPQTVLGVRLPLLRKIAKELAKGDWKVYLREASGKSFEEIMLQGMVIGCVKAELDEILTLVEAFIPKINNWSVCDSFCSGLKLPKLYPQEMWAFIEPYCRDSREYYIRFGVVMQLFYYVDAEHMEEGLERLNSIRSDFYYVKTAVAWAVSIYYAGFPVQTMDYLRHTTLDDFIYNKALQKITELSKLDREEKQIIRLMKRS